MFNVYIGKHFYMYTHTYEYTQNQGKLMEEYSDSVYDPLESDITIVYYDLNPTHFPTCL